jgi:hypothetical protein
MAMREGLRLATPNNPQTPQKLSVALENLTGQAACETPFGCARVLRNCDHRKFICYWGFDLRPRQACELKLKLRSEQRQVAAE